VYRRSAATVMPRTIRVRTGDGVRLSGIGAPALVPAPPAERIGRWAVDAVGVPAAGDTTGPGSRAVPGGSGTIG
jgi:hypothetical protein